MSGVAMLQRPARVSLQAQVAAFYRENPDTTKEEIATALGLTVPAVKFHLFSLGIKGVPKTRRVSFASELRALVAEHPNYDTTQAARALGVTTVKVRATATVCGIDVRKVDAATRGQLIVLGQHLAAARRAPPPPPEPPKVNSGKLYWLVDAEGQYLDRFCIGMTADRRGAWSGTGAQVAGCKRFFTIAAGLKARVVR